MPTDNINKKVTTKTKGLRDHGDIIDRTIKSVVKYWKQRDPLAPRDESQMVTAILVNYEKFLLEHEPEQFNHSDLFNSKTDES